MVYIIHDKARFLLRKKTEGLRFLQVFFTENQNYIIGFSVYIIMKSEDDVHGAIALILWDTKNTNWIRIIYSRSFFSL